MLERIATKGGGSSAELELVRLTRPFGEPRHVRPRSRQWSRSGKQSSILLISTLTSRYARFDLPMSQDSALDTPYRWQRVISTSNAFQKAEQMAVTAGDCDWCECPHVLPRMADQRDANAEPVERFRLDLLSALSDSSRESRTHRRTR